MSLEENTHQARLEIDESHEELLTNIDAFNNIILSRSENIVCSIGSKQDSFKKEINSLNHEISSSQRELAILTERYMNQQKDCTKNEAKINEINDEINYLNNTKNVILPNKLEEIENNNNIKLQDLHEKKLKLKSLIIKNEIKIKHLLSQCHLFEKYLAVHCYVDNTQNLRICFNQINKYQPEKQYFITLTFIHNQYKIVQSQYNEQEVLRYLEHQLNSQQIGLSQFIKLIRKYFVIMTEKENNQK